MSHTPQVTNTPIESPSDRKVTLKDNAGGKHRMPNGKKKVLTTGSASLETAGHDIAQAESAIPITPIPAPDNPADEPRAGTKRVRSDSASSLSTLPATSLAAVSTPALTNKNNSSGPPAVEGQSTLRTYASLL